MSARPGNWGLLELGRDPLPGDPDEVATEAAHYRDLAQEIRSQVARLRELASGTNELVGRFAPEVRESAEELATHLGQAQGRFDTVAAQLDRWHPELEHGRIETGSLLRRAEDAKHEAAVNEPSGTPVDPTDPAAVAADQARSSRLQQATSELNALVSQCRTLLDDVNGVGDDVARTIEDASSDSLEDSWWDRNVRSFIHEHADFLKLIADVLTWVATGLAIAVLLLSNPAGWIALAAIAFTAGAMVIHTALAANGDGSWADVGMDAFALVTFGAGRLLTSGAKTALAAREGMAAFSAASRTARQAFASASGVFGKAGAWLTRSNLVARNLRGAGAALSRFQQVRGQNLVGDVPVLSWLSFGEKQGALLHQAIQTSVRQHGPGVLLNGALAMSNGARAAFLAGTTADVAGKIVNPSFPGIRPDGAPLLPGVPVVDQWLQEHTVHGAPVFR
ncbi:hypothetical protein DQ244_08965 [Blastococcus sp. TBT05-19]|uniref:hypothetical protein n=1 Tax=Blastococcus sp. TBT05-19 TaxID=2250581 RepID=UPI000DE85A80|nr:hypothetical protein [Blastococcus sp. TBT05-19]RBY91455.1 hypothetical protein DQ244_08965 [Blastococcus sp. TBT05-19]